MIDRRRANRLGVRAAAAALALAIALGGVSTSAAQGINHARSSSGIYFVARYGPVCARSVCRYAPFAGATIRVFDRRGRILRQAHTGRAGAVRLGLPIGRYTVAVVAPWKGELYKRTARGVRVTEGYYTPFGFHLCTQAGGC